MELFLITSHWPLSTVHEFLDDEIQYLAKEFDRITLAPMRPQTNLAPVLPARVQVDRSLADHLVHSRINRSLPSRGLTTVVRNLRPSVSRPGFRPGDLLADGLDARWLRTFLLRRSDVTSVADWASKRPTPDVAYTFWLGAATVGLRVAWPGVPLVSRIHGGDLFSEAHGWASIPYQEEALSCVDLAASVSGRGRAYLADKYPGFASKLVIRRLGIQDLVPSPTEHEPGRLSVVSVSNINANKRVTLIAEALAHLARTNRRVEWTHLGEGPGRNELELLLAKRPENLIVNLRGQVSADSVREELTSGRHSVFINVSLSEGAPVSLMEAQCAGLPTVATAVGGTPEVVPAEWNELVGPEESVSGIAAAVLRAVHRPKGEAAERRSHWARLFNAERNYAAWASELRRYGESGRWHEVGG